MRMLPRPRRLNRQRPIPWGLGCNDCLAPFAYQPTRRGLAGLDSFGINAGTTGSAASGAASGAAIGTAIVPGIGTAIGAAAGAIISLFGSKSNPQIQIDKNSAVNLFDQYVNVAGTVSGRSIGLQNMNFVWRGAAFSGHFPGWKNDTGRIDTAMNMNGKGGGCANCFAGLWQYAQSGAPSSHYPQDTGNGGVPVRDAKTFIDRYFWPSNSKPDDTDPWATNTDAIGKQILYDAADAFIATMVASSVPYIANQQQPSAGSSTPTSAPAPASSSAAGSQSYAAAGTVLQHDTTAIMMTPIGTFIGIAGGSYNYSAPGSSSQTQIALSPAHTGGVGTLSLTWTGSQVIASNSDGTQYVFNPSTMGWVPSSIAPSPASAPASSPTAPTPPAIGAPITSAPDQVTGNVVTLPPGATFGGSSGGAWLIVYPPGTASPGTYQLANGTLIGIPSAGPLTMAAPAVSVPTTIPQVTPTTAAGSAAVGTTSSGQTVTQADLQSLVSGMASQGASAQQAYSAAIQSLQNQGVQPTAAVQSAVQNAVASTPATAGVDTGSGWLGVGLVALTVIFATARPAGVPRRRRRGR
jgi:hypothetical protein